MNSAPTSNAKNASNANKSHGDNPANLPRHLQNLPRYVTDRNQIYNYQTLNIRRLAAVDPVIRALKALATIEPATDCGGFSSREVMLMAAKLLDSIGAPVNLSGDIVALNEMAAVIEGHVKACGDGGEKQEK
mgnify:CR=1 FL=1|jgi:hypothetical protein